MTSGSEFRRVPIVDLAAWFHGSPRQRREVARQLCRVCEDVGFAYVANHAVPHVLVEQAFIAAATFFQLPQREKQALHFRNTGLHRGYIPPEAERTDPLGPPDLKEAFDCGLVVPPPAGNNAAAARMAAPNQWPVALPGFRVAVQRYLDSALHLARELFRMVAVGLGLPETYFDGEIDRPIAQMRLLRYPGSHTARDEHATAVGIGAHCDYECFTILAQDGTPGLQVQNGRGDWVDTPHVPGTFVINVGEMLTRWSNGRLRATVHRVVSTGRERYAIPLFVGTNYDTVIRCLAPCVSDAQPAQYPAVLAGDYLADRLRTIYGAT